MSRNYRALRSLCSPSSLRVFLTRIGVERVKPRNENDARVPGTAVLFPFLSSVGESKTELLNRFCSSRSLSKNSKDGKRTKSKPTSSNGIKPASNKTENKRPSVSAAPAKTSETEQSSRMDPMAKENPTEKRNLTDKSNVASGPSTSLDDNVDEQLKRLTEFIEGLSNSRKAFNFRGQALQGFGPFMQKWLGGTSTFIEAMFNGFYQRIIRNMLDSDFDILEFLEGAKDAFYMVNRLFEDADFETLKPMVSSKLFESMRDAVEEYRSKGYRFSISPENIIGAHVYALKIVKAKNLIQFGNEFDIPDVIDGKQGFFVMIYVRFTRNEHYQLFRTTGEVVDDKTSVRRDIWTFVRGPVTALPYEGNSPGWIVLNIS